MKGWDASVVFRLLVIAVAGWFRESEQLVVAYLREENRVLREQLAAEQRRLRFTDEQRRRLAVRAEPLGIAVLRGLGTVVTPATLLRWYRQLVATKYDGSRKRISGRPPTKADVAKLVLAMARQSDLGLHAASRRAVQRRA